MEGQLKRSSPFCGAGFTLEEKAVWNGRGHSVLVMACDPVVFLGAPTGIHLVLLCAWHLCMQW
eukprot:c30729_g1_i1 orf=105-293(+)